MDIPVSGITRVPPRLKGKDNYRVYLSGSTKGSFIDTRTLIMAQATCCGNDNAVIYALLTHQKFKSS